ncbi:MAG: ComEC/Rec2 family competence protein [Lachnospiraceae bacterium]
MAGGIFIRRQLARAIAHGSRLSFFYHFYQGMGAGPFCFFLCLTGMAGAVLTALFLMKDRKRSLYHGVAAGLCFLVGFILCGKAMEISRYDAWDRTEITGTGKISGISEKNGNLILEICHIKLDGTDHDTLPGKLHVILENNLETDQQIAIGRQIRFTGIFTLYNEGTNPGEFDYREYCRSLGIAGQVSCSMQMVSFYGRKSFFLLTLYEWKQKIRDKFHEIASEEDAGVLICLVTGEKSELPKRWKELFMEGGIIHLLTISGLHISILGMGVFRILRETVLGLAGGSLLAGGITVVFCLMTGSGTSTVRAVICFLLFLLAEFTGKTYDFLTGIALAGILILADHPLMLFQSGFLMTYSCVLGIGILFPLCEAIFCPEKPWEKAVMSSVLLQTVSLPAQMWFQGKISVFAVLINMMTVPWMGMVLLSAFTGLLAGFLWNPFGTCLLGAAHVILQFFREICLLAEGIPFSCLVTGQPRWWQCLLWFAFLFVFLGKKWRILLRKHKRSRWNRCLLLLPVSVLLLKRVPLPWISSVYLDVGQGDGIVIEMPWNRTVICIDGGSSSRKKIGEYVYEPFFLHEGIGAVDYWFITHPDSDHYSGMLELLENGYPIGTILMPAVFQGSEAALQIENMHPIQYIQAGDSLVFSRNDPIRLEVLHPGESCLDGNSNDQSAVLLLTAGNLQFLYTGDMEERGEEAVINRLQRSQTDETASTEDTNSAAGEKVNSAAGGKTDTFLILKTAHHGSRTSTSEAFLEAIRPAMAVISSGKNNRYGHPHPEVLNRFQDRKIRWWNTADAGCIRITGGKRITVEDKYCKTGSFRI